MHHLYFTMWISSHYLLLAIAFSSAFNHGGSVYGLRGVVRIFPIGIYKLVEETALHFIALFYISLICFPNAVSRLLCLFFIYLFFVVASKNLMRHKKVNLRFANKPCAL